MRGKLERVKNGQIYAWLLDENNPDAHVPFEVFFNGRSLGAGLANILRLDLRNKNIGNGDHAIRYTIPDEIVLKVGDIVELRSPQNGQKLLVPLVLNEEMTLRDRKVSHSQPAVKPSMEKAFSLFPEGVQVLSQLAKRWTGWVGLQKASPEPESEAVDIADIIPSAAPAPPITTATAPDSNVSEQTAPPKEPSVKPKPEKSAKLTKEQLAQILEQAASYNTGGDLGDAIAYLERAAMQNPHQRLTLEMAKLYRQEGHRFRQEKREAKALNSYERAYGLVPDNADFALDYSRALINNKDPEAALTILAEVAFQEKSAQFVAKYMFEKGRAERLSGLNEDAKSSFAAAVEADALQTGAAGQLADLFRKKGDFEQCAHYAEISLKRTPNDARMLRLQTLSLLALGREDQARSGCQVLERLTSESAEWIYAQLLDDCGRTAEAVKAYENLNGAINTKGRLNLLLGRAYLKVRRPEMALPALVAAEKDLADNADLYHSLGVACRQLSHMDDAEMYFAKAISVNPKKINSLLDLAELKHIRGNLDGALTLISEALAVAPDNVRGYLARAGINYERGQTDEAIIDCEAALSSEPNNAKAQSQLSMMKAGRVYQVERSISDVFFLDPEKISTEAFSASSKFFNRVIVNDAASDVAAVLMDAQCIAAHLTDLGDISDTDHVFIVRGDLDSDKLNSLTDHLGLGVGAVSSDVEFTHSLWNRAVLHALLRSGEACDFEALLGVAQRNIHARIVNMETGLSPLPAKHLGEGREVWLVSGRGTDLFGGVERFLRSIVPIYRDMGFKPVIVGLVENTADCGEGQVDGVEFVNMLRHVDALRELALQRHPALAHTTTGVSHEMITAAVDGLKTRVIYGTHFWRDAFYGNGAWENIDIDTRARPEFQIFCARASQAYANSIYTRNMLFEHFGFTQPLLYSLPFDVSADDVKKDGEGYALLMNGRPDKGLPLVIEAALRAPHVPFKVVASQVSADRVREMAHSRGADNIEVIDWVSDTATLYKGARAVLVPSYAFIETFSRVTIEAQRFGVPVVGSNRGNVRLLLEGNGICLPEDPDVWADELDRLFTDDAYWAERSRAARANADLYLHADQNRRLEGIVRTSYLRIAVGIGAGIGNIIQCTPAIRRISEYFNCPVDIILREDFPGCEALFKDSPWVGTIMRADDVYCSATRFDAVILFNAFGTLVPKFNTDRLLVMRRTYDFALTMTQHEADFYLKASCEMLGMPYDPADAAHYFLGGWKAAPVEKRIGVHAGCKDGVWLAKRWPYFEDLIDALKAKGYQIFSFGSDNEYVPGTVDATGTDLETTIRNISTCSYFIANDSGLMHIADALEIPLASIFGPTSVVKNGPLSKHSRVFAVEKDCAPCQFDMEKLATCKCIGEITLETVLAGVEEDLRRLEVLPAKARGKTARQGKTNQKKARSKQKPV